MAAAHVGVSNTVVGGGVAGNGRIGATSNDQHGVSSVGRAGVSVVDENITSLDVGWRRLILAAGASPAVGTVETITKVLCTGLLLAARITTARATLIQRLVATSVKALAHKVGAITTSTGVATMLRTEVGPGRA